MAHPGDGLVTHLSSQAAWSFQVQALMRPRQACNKESFGHSGSHWTRYGLRGAFPFLRGHPGIINL